MSIAEKRITQPLKWHGGKHYLAKRIIKLMPPRCENPNKPAADDPGWLHYVEPYFGGGSVLFQMDPEGISEVVNDANEDLTNFWFCLASEMTRDELLNKLNFIEFSEFKFSEAQSFMSDYNLDECDSVHRAAMFFIRYRQSRQGLGKDFATLTRNRTRRGMNEQVSSWLTAIEGLPEAHERLKRVVILNRDAIDVIRQQDGPRTLFYLDPSYLHHDEDGTPIRVTTKDYEHEMSINDHTAMLDCLAGVKGRFLLSGYHSKLYERYRRRLSWTAHEFEIDNKASCKKEKEIKTEVVWCNF